MIASVGRVGGLPTHADGVGEHLQPSCQISDLLKQNQEECLPTRVLRDSLPTSLYSKVADHQKTSLRRNFYVESRILEIPIKIYRYKLILRVFALIKYHISPTCFLFSPWICSSWNRPRISMDSHGVSMGGNSTRESWKRLQFVGLSWGSRFPMAIYFRA